MFPQLIDPEEDRTRRRIRTRIGRLRRRIDGRIRASQREGRRLMSWRTYAARYPGNLILAALGAGLAFSAGLSGRRLLRWIGTGMFRKAGRHLGRSVWREIRQVWTESAPCDPSADKSGDDHARA